MTEWNTFFWARCAGQNDCVSDRDNGFICEREGKLIMYQEAKKLIWYMILFYLQSTRKYLDQKPNCNGDPNV